MTDKGVAFLVGIDTYTQEELKTFNGEPTEDVRSLRRIFLENLENNFSRYKLYEPESIKNGNGLITNKQLKEALEELFSQENNYKDVLIYFSGHGYQIKKSKEGYLATSDCILHFHTDDANVIVGEQNGLSFDDLSEIISKATHLNSIVLLLDACHSGYAIQEDILKNSFKLKSGFNYCIIASSLSSQKSFISRGKSLFTEHLIAKLEDKNSGQIKSEDLFSYINEKLKNDPHLQQSIRVLGGENSFILMDYPSTGLNVPIKPIPDKKTGEIMCPYRGLDYFDDDEDQEKFFFGREADIQKIRTKLDNSSFVLVIGASGSGKSSVVRAGLVQRQLKQKEEDWHILKIIKPGDYPLDSLRKAFEILQEYLTENHPAYKAINNFTNHRLTTFQTVKTLETILEQLRGAEKYLLVIDQFEEVFTLTVSENQSQCEPDEAKEQKAQRVQERDQFLELITRVAEVKDSPLKVVVTMRADYIGSCLKYPTLKDLIDKDVNVYYIAPLVGSGLIKAIKEPAARQGYPIDQDLEDALVKDVANEPGYLPLLEFTLEQLWKKRVDEPKPCIPLTAYSSLGGESSKEDKTQKISGLKQALNLHANKVYKYSDSFELEEQELDGLPELKRSKKEQEWIRLIFLRLVRTGEGNTDTRHPQLHSSLLTMVEERDVERLKQVIDSLVKGRLLVSDQSASTSQDQVIDLAHEALIDGWQQFATWRLVDREIRRAAERLEDARQDWEKAEEKDKTQYLINRALLAQVREHWGRLKFYLKDPKGTGEFYRLSSKYEQAEKLELQLQVDATKVERWISVRKPPLEILTLAIQTIGKNREQIPEKLVGSVPASLRQVVEKIFTAPLPYGHTNYVTSVAFSPDGETIVSGSGDNSLRLWNLDGTPKGNPLAGHTAPVSSVAFSPDGETIVSGSGDNSLRLWNLDGTPKGNPLAGHRAPVTSVAFSPDGETIVSGSGDNSLRLWNLDSTPKGNPLEGHTGYVYSVAFSPDGETIVSGSWDNSLRLWNLDGTPKGNPLAGHTSYVYSVAFSPDGETIVSGSWDNSLRLWNLDGTPKGNPLEGHTGYVYSVAFSPDGETIVSGSWDNSLRLWNLDGTPKSNPLEGHTNYIISVAFSPDGETIVSGSWDNSLRLWNLDGTPKSNPLEGHTNYIISVAFSPDGETIVSGSWDNSLRLWNLDGTPKGNPLEGHTAPVSSVAFSPDGETIVSGSWDNSLRLWNLDGTPKSNPLEGHTNYIISVAFSPDGETIVSGSWDNSLRLWNLDGTPKGNPLEGHTAPVSSVAFSPDGQTIVSGSWDNSLRLWNLDGTPKGNPLEGHTGSVTSVAFSPDGQTIVSGSNDISLRLWNLDGTPKGNPLEGHTNFVTSVAFSPDGETIVSGSGDMTVRLWKQTSWRCWLRTCLNRLGNNWTYDKEGIAARTRLFEEGYCLAEQNAIEPAIIRLKQALKCGKASLGSETYLTDIDTTLSLDEKLAASAKRLIAPIAIQQGQYLARSGDYDRALTKFKQAKELNPDLTLDPVVEAQRLTAPILKMQGTFAALEGKISEAIAKFEQAKQYGLILEFEPEAEAKRIAASVLVAQGKKLAEDVAVEEPIAKFEQAKQYGLDLEFEPEAEAKRIAASVLVEQGKKLAEDVAVEEAIAKVEQAKQYGLDLESEPEVEAKSIAAPVLVEQGKKLAEDVAIEEAIAKFEQEGKKLAEDVAVEEAIAKLDQSFTQILHLPGKHGENQ